jgi:uncharacterized protein YndB with AHSA1/START domain
MAAQANPVNKTAQDSENELVLTRVFNAPARVVYEAWTKPQHIKRWFGPVGYPVATANMDFRVGGKWRFIMTGPDGKEGPPFGGEYLEIVPNRKIVLTDAFEAPGADVLTFTVTFDEKDGKTTQTLRVTYPSPEVFKRYREMGMAEGLNSGLDQLADVVKTMQEPESQRELAIHRVFDAPARLVYEAWTKPEHIKKWFGPVGYPVTMAEMDFRVGGKWRFAMTGPSGVQNTPFGGQYLEIVPNRKIAFTNAFEKPEPGITHGTMVMTVTFDEKDGKTNMTWHTLFESIAQCKDHVGHGMEAGTNSGLDQLADLLKTMR